MFPAVTVVLLGLLAFRSPGGPTASGPDTPRLPGARPTIDASQFPSLQAAFDALPKDGGQVRLPAGTFEIDRPLVLSREDVSIVGAGTATHIKNTNTDGQPALVIQPSDLAKNPRSRIWRIKLADFRITGNP